MSDPAERPFSTAWVMLSLVLFLAFALLMGLCSGLVHASGF